MKNLKSIALALVIALGTTLSASAQTTKKVDVAASKINWVGKKVTGEHSGTINLKEGALVFNGKKLVGGNFTVDMNSINTTDLEGKGKSGLDGHLKADDFFGVEHHPTATLVFKSIGEKSKNNYTVNADLTIKGITKPITFDIAVNKDVATTKLAVDRTKYDIKYGSGSFFEGLGDKTISDNFDLAVSLKF